MTHEIDNDIKVVSATDLPDAEQLSKIEPYLIVDGNNEPIATANLSTQILVKTKTGRVIGSAQNLNELLFIIRLKKENIMRDKQQFNLLKQLEKIRDKVNAAAMKPFYPKP